MQFQKLTALKVLIHRIWCGPTIRRPVINSNFSALIRLAFIAQILFSTAKTLSWISLYSGSSNAFSTSCLLIYNQTNLLVGKAEYWPVQYVKICGISSPGSPWFATSSPCWTCSVAPSFKIFLKQLHGFSRWYGQIEWG